MPAKVKKSTMSPHKPEDWPRKCQCLICRGGRAGDRLLGLQASKLRDSGAVHDGRRIEA
jgi:hypothetical protein